MIFIARHGGQWLGKLSEPGRNSAPSACMTSGGLEAPAAKSEVGDG